jgi:ankyrin repeat protein
MSSGRLKKPLNPFYSYKKGINDAMFTHCSFDDEAKEIIDLSLRIAENQIARFPMCGWIQDKTIQSRCRLGLDKDQLENPRIVETVTKAFKPNQFVMAQDRRDGSGVVHEEVIKQVYEKEDKLRDSKEIIGLSFDKRGWVNRSAKNLSIFDLDPLASCCFMFRSDYDARADKVQNTFEYHLKRSLPKKPFTLFLKAAENEFKRLKIQGIPCAYTDEGCYTFPVEDRWEQIRELKDEEEKIKVIKTLLMSNLYRLATYTNASFEIKYSPNKNGFEKDLKRVINVAKEYGIDIEPDFIPNVIEESFNNKETALILAAQQGFTENVETLLALGADIQRQARNGNTALMSAILNKQTATASLLIDKIIAKKADVSIQNELDQNALMLAIEMKEDKIANRILELDHPGVIQQQDSHGNTALISAILNNQTSIALLLIDKEANVSIRNQLGKNALTIAIEMNEDQVVSRMLKLKLYQSDALASPDLVRSAVHHNNFDMVRLLIENGFDCKSVKIPQDLKKQIQAAKVDLRENIKKLINLINSDVRDEKKINRVIENLVMSDTIKKFPISDLIFKLKTIINNEDGEADKIKKIEKIHESMRTKISFAKKISHYLTAVQNLHRALDQNDLKTLIEILETNNVDISKPILHGMTPIGFAIQHQMSKEIIDHLLQCMIQNKMSLDMPSTPYTLLSAAFSGHYAVFDFLSKQLLKREQKEGAEEGNIADLLLKHIGSISVNDFLGAMKLNQPIAIQVILPILAKNPKANDLMKQALLNSLDHPSTFITLFKLANKADRERAWKKIIESNNISLCQHLLQTMEIDLDVLLGLAIPRGKVDMIDLLIKSGANVNQVNAGGVTPLCQTIAIAQIVGSAYSVTKLLLEAKANVNQADKQGNNTPLILAIKNNQIEIVKLLLEAKVDVNQADSSGYTPLGLAITECKNDSFQMVKLLLEAKADINQESNGKKPAILAQQTSNTAVLGLIDPSSVVKMASVPAILLSPPDRDKKPMNDRELINAAKTEFFVRVKRAEKKPITQYSKLHDLVSEAIERSLNNQSDDLITKIIGFMRGNNAMQEEVKQLFEKAKQGRSYEPRKLT